MAEESNEELDWVAMDAQLNADLQMHKYSRTDRGRCFEQPLESLASSNKSSSFYLLHHLIPLFASLSMDLPSSRELELEILLREKDAQLAEVTDEITVLRQYLSKQPGPSATESVTLPPALLSVLWPHINTAANNTASSSSSTVTAALTQRARLLQEENDELYELLKHSETGKLKDEVRGLRRVVAKLEGALKDSHKAITSLSTELDKAYEALMSSSRQIGNVNKSHSHSPRNSYYNVAYADSAGNGNSSLKPPPTEPRAHKRPRLSESQPSPPAPLPPRLAPSLPQKPQIHHTSNALPSRADHPRDQGRHPPDNTRGKANVKMEVDGDERVPSPPNRERDRNRERERNNRDRERDRERGVKERERARGDTGKEWDRDGNKNSNSRRNGHSHTSGSSGRGGGGSGGGGGPPGRKGNERNNNPSSNNHMSDNASRTLQERLGL
ncbi:hypothetical protein BDZ97DRAFT_1773577 [Flammula alnicola]|nr:hypothetical protein BDZ97DRAFT_1773577 [Flammula alnicola]